MPSPPRSRRGRSSTNRTPHSPRRARARRGFLISRAGSAGVIPRALANGREGRMIDPEETFPPEARVTEPAMDHRPSLDLLESTHVFPGVYRIKVIGSADEDFEARALDAVSSKLAGA